MIFQGTANPAQLALLRKALNEHCAEVGIHTSDSTNRDMIAGRIFCLFESGVNSLEVLKRALKADQPV